MLHWFEEARTEHLRALGSPYGELEDRGFFFPVREVQCRYRRPARFDEQIDVQIVNVETAGASVRYEYRVMLVVGEVLVAEGSTLHACVNRSGRPVRLPDDVRALFG